MSAARSFAISHNFRQLIVVFVRLCKVRHAHIYVAQHTVLFIRALTARETTLTGMCPNHHCITSYTYTVSLYENHNKPFDIIL